MMTGEKETAAAVVEIDVVTGGVVIATVVSMTVAVAVTTTQMLMLIMMQMKRQVVKGCWHVPGWYTVLQWLSLWLSLGVMGC
jgi:hypothetical protein